MWVGSTTLWFGIAPISILGHTVLQVRPRLLDNQVAACAVSSGIHCEPLARSQTQYAHLPEVCCQMSANSPNQCGTISRR
jgi:hypothetical protein